MSKYREVIDEFMCDAGEMAEEIISLRAQLDEAKALVLEEAAGYQDDIERYHQRALKAEAQLEAQSGEAVAWIHPDQVDNADLDIPVRFTVQSKPWGTDSIPLFTSPPAAKVPDYRTIRKAIALFDDEYVGQHCASLWDWAYNKAAQEGEK